MSKSWLSYILTIILLGTMLSAFLPFQSAYANPGPSWYNSDWLYRKKITINSANVSDNFNDFPVLISITDSDLRDDAKSDGSDIVFTASDGLTKLKREIESYDNSDGTLVTWVKTDLSSTADTELYMYYGNSGASETDDTDTWDTNFKGVWHLDETSTAPIVQEDLETNQGTGSSLNVPNVTVQNNNRVLYVFVTMRNQNYQTTSSVKWKSGGSEQDFGSAIATVARDDDAQTEVFRLIAPTTGTDTVYCTFSAAVGSGVAAAVVSLSGVDQTTPNGTVATDQADSAEPALTVTSGGDTEVVYAACAAEYGTLTSDEPATEIWNITQSGHMSAGGKKTGASPNVSFGWATGNSSSHWAVAGFSVKPDEQVKDSTSNANHGTTQNMDPGDQVAGKIDGSLDFDGGNDRIGMGDILTFTPSQPLMISGWFNVDSFASYNPIIERTNGEWRTDYGMLIRDSTTVSYHYDDNVTDDIYIDWTVSQMSTGEWHHLALNIYADDTVTAYFDGQTLSNQAGLHGDWGATGFYAGTGDDAATWQYFDGTLDEVRISNTDRSAAWIETSYNNQSAPGNFYSVGSEETVTYQPDNQIRNTGEGTYTGNSTYNNDGTNQTKSQSVNNNVTATYEIKIENDGNVSDNFTVTGNATAGGWTVAYYDALSGGNDITAQVTGAGWPTGSLASGNFTEIRVEVTPDGTLAGGSSKDALVTSSSAGDGTQDAVKASTTVTAMETTPPAGGSGGGQYTYLMTVNMLDNATIYLINSDGEIPKTIEVTSEDKLITLTIPKGTIAKDGKRLTDLEVTVDESQFAPPEGATTIGLAYNFTPDGATFNPPITLMFVYDPSEMPPGIDEEDLVLAYFNGELSKWVELERVIDTEANTISAQVSHFTIFGVFAYSVVVPPVLLPPTFENSSLNISPAEVGNGEEVTISVLVANTGGGSGSYMVTLKIDGVVKADKDITLNAGASKQVSFTTLQNTNGTYSVDVNGLSGTFEVKEKPEQPVIPPDKPAPLPTPTKQLINWPALGGVIAAVVVVGLLIFFAVRRESRLAISRQ